MPAPQPADRVELTESQYARLVEAYVRAQSEESTGLSPEEVAAELEDAAMLTAEQIREDPTSTTGWNSDLWDTLMTNLNEEHGSAVADAVARRCGEIAGLPLPALPTEGQQ